MRSNLETREEAWFRNQTTKLWKLASQALPYQCSSRCRAPPDFYLGIPWIDATNQSFVDGDVNVKVVCRVWDGIVVGNQKNSGNWMWFFNDQLLFRQEVDKEPILEDEAS